MFEPRVYRERREELARRVGSGLLLFVGNEASPTNYADNAFPFWQDGSFLYYWGLQQPGLAALLDADSRHAVLFGREPDVEETVWTGPVPSLAARAEATGADEGAPIAGLPDRLRAARDAGRELLFLPAARPETRLKLHAWLGVPPGAVERHVSRRFLEAVVAQRSVKDPEEIAEIEGAVAIAVRMQREGMRAVRPGVSEEEAAAAVEAVALREGRGLSFPTILSRRGGFLHVHPTGDRLEAGDLVVHDSGARARSGYASDLTRTLPVGGRFEGIQRDLYDVVLRAEEAAIDAIRPGRPFREIHLLAARLLVEGLRDLGFMRGDPEEAVAEGAHTLFFPCGVGHMMGIDVHDMEGLDEDVVGYGEGFERDPRFGFRSLRLARPLRPGFVVTVEPGVYLNPLLIDRWRGERRYAAFVDYDRVATIRDLGGIRIEDDVLVTADGGRVLGPPLEKAPGEIEAAVAA
jgi:Xaa-Pro aminopeptidase